MIKRQWPGSPKCYFCHKNETMLHLFFECTVARVVCGCLGYLLGTDMIPSSTWQYFIWMRRFVPGLKTFFVEGLGAVCWAIWKTRNSVCFERKIVHHSTAIVFLLCSLLQYWAEMQKDLKMRQGIVEGALELLQATIRLRRRHQAARPGD